MFLSFSIDDYVIFLYQIICINYINIHILVLFWDLLCMFCFFCFLFRSIVFSVNNILTLGAFGCFSFVINLCEISWSFSSDSFQYCFWSFTDVDIFWCGKCSRIAILLLIIYWWLTIFHVQNVLIILNWCLCDFLVLKHINELHTLHLHWSFTDVGHIFMWKMFHPFWISFVFGLICVFWSIVFSVRNVLVLGAFVINLCELLLPFSCELFQYCFWLFTDVDYLSCAKYCYHSQLMFMWFSYTETYRWPMNGMHFIFIAHLLMLTYFCVENVPEFQYYFWLFTDVD